MGNVVGGGYASPVREAGASAGDEYLARLSDAEIKRYTEGYRRICRSEGGAGSSAGDSSPLAVRGKSASPAASAGIPSAFLPKRGGRPAVAGANNAQIPNASVAAGDASGDALQPGNGGGVVTKKLFRNKVLGAFTMIPHSLSDRLFEVLDSERTGELTLENVLSGIAWLKHGSYEEQVQLLFIIYDLDGAGKVARDVLDRFMDVIYGRKRARHRTTVMFLDDIFDGRPSLSLEDFREVVQRKDSRGDALLVKWLASLAVKIGNEDDADILALEKKYNPVVIRHRIADATQFTISEVAALERQFQRLFDAKSGASARVPSDQFVDILSEQNFPKSLLTRFVAATALPEVVTFDEFCQFVSDFCRGTRGAKMRHLFRIYKDDDTGRVPLDAVEEIIHVGAKCDSEDWDSDIDSEQRTLVEEQQLSEISASITADEGWDEESFVEWAAEARSAERLVHQLAFAACLLVGVKPSSPYLEKRIVTWHWRLASQSISVGQSWNLVAAEWWRKWSDYVGMNPLVGTPYGSLAIPQLLPGTKVTPPPRNNVRSQAISLAMHADRPGPVYNWTLLRASGSRRLKESLVLGNDYYLVPSTVYTVLVQWYSGGPDLSRVVVSTVSRTSVQQDSHENPSDAASKESVVIELFPLVLRVARVEASTGGVIMSGEEVILSRLSTPDSLLEATCRALLLLKLMDKARLWYFNESTPGRKLPVRRDNPQELSKLTQTSVFLVELQDEDGSWPLSQSGDKQATTKKGGGSGRSPGRSPSQENYSSSSDESGDGSDDSDDDSEYSPSGRRQAGANGTNSQRKRPREPRPSRTSEFCSRGNLEVLTALGSSYASSGHNQHHKGKNHLDDMSNAATNGAQPASDVDAMAAGASSTIRKRFSKDAFKGQGLVGLDNLGNTCYMSSALQCLSHTRLLVEYFKNEAYLRDINLRNRDGTNGKLVVAFGELLRVLWTSEKKRFSPSEFKRVLAKCHPQFVGSDQHDAQELLACLLSSLSEDLNRIMTKPYTEQPDSNGRSDALVANEWWENHLKREVSVIVALFTGQYKSLLECSICGYESARFEPFTFLQLSLPESNYRSIVMTLIFRTDRVPMRYSVRVKTNATVSAVKQQVGAYFAQIASNESEGNEEGSSTSTPVEIVLARTSNFHTIEALLDDALPLSQIPEKDQLSAFELDMMDDIVSRDLHNSGAIESRAVERGQLSITGGVPKSSNQTDKAMNGHSHSETKDSAVKGKTVENPVDSDDDDDDTSSMSSDSEVLPIGTSVYVRVDKTKELAAARVVGSSVANGTINVAYPSGVRRYHVPLSKVIERRQNEAYIYLVHRRVERSTNSFTNAHITRLFGAPLVLRISLRKTTAYNLYMLVWNRLRRIFNWKEPPSPIDRASLSLPDELEEEGRFRTDTSCLALGRHLASTKFGFCLRMVTSHGIGCSRCEWIDGCLGCLIVPLSDTPVELAAEETIAIDWDIRTLKEEYDPIQASKLEFDESVLANRKQDNMPLNLDHCLEIFTAKENIQEAFCGRCRALRPATKKMDFWRLPPLLVIQLKRFCYTQVSRRKLHHLVDFPLRGLDLHAYLARRHEPNTKKQDSGLSHWQFLGGKLLGKKEESGGDNHGQSQLNGQMSESSAASTASTSTNGDLHHNVSVPALNAPAIAASVVGKDDGSLYDLYAVVNHVGALGGGHYFAYVLSETDGKWKCFNDHQCKDVDENEVVSSTAYILFYRRRDMEHIPIEQLFPPLASRREHPASSDKETAAKDQQHVEELLEQSKLAANGGGSSCIVS